MRDDTRMNDGREVGDASRGDGDGQVNGWIVMLVLGGAAIGRNEQERRGGEETKTLRWRK